MIHQYKRSASQIRKIKQIVVECFNRMKQTEIIKSRVMLVISNHVKYYNIKKQFTLYMFLKVDSIIFTERLVY